MFFYGDLSVLTPASLLQIVCQEQRSLCISAWRGSSEAYIHIDEGLIVDARCDDIIGEEAVYRVVAWDSGRFQLTYAPASPNETDIVNHWEALVLEAARRRDELELTIEPLTAPSWREAGAILQACPMLAGVALVGYDGRMLVSIGINRQLDDHVPTIASALAVAGKALKASVPSSDEPDIAVYTSHSHTFFLADSHDNTTILAIPAPDADLDQARDQIAAYLRVVH